MPASETPPFPAPEIPDYQLLRHIGSGNFGEIWLAQAKATGRYRAVKVVYRAKFDDDQPYDLEFAGLKRFEIVSLEHPGFVDILHITRDDARGCFACVMELADDLTRGPQISPAEYTPHTLSARLGLHGRLPVQECARIGSALAGAIADLHTRGLVHRDIKPSNILFVRGVPKLADVGLVTEVLLKPGSVVAGTFEYMDYEVQGTVQGDLYGLGKVLYVMATGLPSLAFPQRPSEWASWPDRADFEALEEVWLRACHSDRTQRYADAAAMAQALTLVENLTGPHGHRWRRLEHWVSTVRRYGIAALSLALASGVLVLGWLGKQKHRAELRERKVGLLVANGTQAVEAQDYAGALPWFAEAMRLDRETPEAQAVHALRLGTVLQRCPTLTQMWFRDSGHPFVAFADAENQVLVPEGFGRWSIHDLGSGRPLHPAFGWGGKDESITFSPRSHRAATVLDGEARIRLWNTTTGDALPPIFHARPIRALALSDDGTRLAAADVADGIAVWALPGGTLLAELQGHSGTILDLAFSRDARQLASSGEDQRAIVWDLEARAAALVVTNHTSWVFGVAFSPDGRRLATACFDRLVRIWSVPDGVQASPPLQHADGVYKVQFSHDGRRLLSSSFDYVVRIWNPETSLPEVWLRHNSKPLAAAFSPNDQQVVTLDYGGIIRVWQLPRELAAPPAPGPITARNGVTLSASNQLATIDIEGVAGNRLPIDLGSGRIADSLLAQDGKHFVAITEGTNAALQAQLWATSPGTALGPIIALSRPASVRAIDRIGRTLIEYDTNGVCAWDLVTGQRLWRHAASIGAACLDPHGARLAVGVGWQCQVWQIRNGPVRQLHSLAHANQVRALAWSPDGQRLAVAGQDETLSADAAELWDVDTGERCGRPLQHRDGISAMAFSRDGKRIVTCSEDFTAMLWDVRTGNQATPPLRHHHRVLHAAFGEDDQWLATVSADRTVRIWDARTGEAITPPLVHPEPLRAVELVSASARLLVRSHQDRIYVWDLPINHRPVPDVHLIAQLLSGQSVHATESVMFQSREKLQAGWDYLRKQYPDDFAWRR